MTYLELVRRLAMESLASGVSVQTTVNVAGEIGRLCNWINSALNDIETSHQDWQWMRKQTQFETTEGKAVYTLGDLNISDFSQWVPRNFRNYPTTVGDVGEIIMDHTDWESYRNTYLYGATRYTASRPAVIAVDPYKSLAIGPVPAAGYTVTGEYYRRPQVLSGDDDTPDMPVQFQEAIVWKALMLYGSYEAAPDAYQRGQENYGRLARRMATDQLPGMGEGAALA